MKIPGLFFFGFFALASLSAQQKRIYLAPDDHTDYMWSADENGYRDAFLGMLDFYIGLNDSTAGEPYPFRSKWNCDGSFWVREYEQNRSPVMFSRLIRQIRSGSITVPLNSLTELSGIAPVEAVIRDMYYAGSLERRFGLDLDIVINMEDQVLPLGLSSVWAGAGAKYSWRGVCDCATKVKGLHARQHEIYWYQGLDGQRILMKWYSLGENNMQLGGYAEARDPDKSILLCKQIINTPSYPYLIAGAFGKGGDDLQTETDEFLRAARLNTDQEYSIIVSNETDFFRDFEKNYGDVLPSESVSYGSTEWGNSIASLAAVSAKFRRSVEKLRAAEGLYTLVAIRDKNFGNELDAARQQAWIACGLYFDHDWTADGPVITKKQRADWAREKEHELSSYVDTIFRLSAARLGELLRIPDNAREAFFVYNPLSWPRTDYCDYRYEGPENVRIVDQVGSREVPFQFITVNNLRYLRILAREVPSLGYRVYSIEHEGNPPLTAPEVKTNDGCIENTRYRIRVTPQGVITSIVDKQAGNRECIRLINGRLTNDLGSGAGTSGFPLKVENSGPVSATLTAESYKPLKHTTKITLFGFNDRIEIENYIRQNFGAGPVTYAFSFDLSEPEIHNEEAGAILLARQQSGGGNYADSICRLDWIALNHFADLSDGNDGVTISNRDAFLMKTGNSTVEKLDPVTSQVSILAGGQIDAPSLGIACQDGDSYFEDFFALRFYRDDFNAYEAMKFALEHQNPLISGKISGKSGSRENIYSLFSFSEPEIIVWALKPSEEGIGNGIILRVWNLSDKDKEVTVKSAEKIDKCFNTTHIEKNLFAVPTEPDMLKVKIGHNRLMTFRIILK